MALSSYDDLWRGVLLRCPLAGPFLARQWISFAFRELVEKRRWSWLLKRQQFFFNQVYATGSVAVTRLSTSVVGTGTTFTAAMVGRQFRTGTNVPVYTIASYTDATHITLNEPYGDATNSSLGYQIWNAYFTVPSDFHSFLSVWDPLQAWQLYTNWSQMEINAIDPQRTNSGPSWVMAQYAYTATSSPTPPLPQYEAWPYQYSDYVLPYLYESRPPDLQDAGATIPRYIRGDVLLEMALAQCARWPGPSREQPNPYFNLALAMQHDKRAEFHVAELERQDDEVYEADVAYQAATALPYPFALGDARFLQRHAI